ncbi:MAG: hypothetical protein CMB80_08830 [Flammeovirgaceae bacterium]|nr:hypothetical protein [Flammeovirgaceae bacterium]|tara:strand:+ start:3213 stop:3929 length:717 start_codon:yes stop_codon:yes gene_type:complete
MAQFGWAYINCSDTGSGGGGLGSGSAGPPQSIQIMTDSGSFTTGSANLVYYTASYWGYEPSSMVLSGNLYVTGTISASMYHIEDIAVIDATGSTYFGDSIDDTHRRTGTLTVSGTTDYVLSASATTMRTWVRGFGGRYRQITTTGEHILQNDDYIIGCSQSAGSDQTLCLPTASVVGAGMMLVIKDESNRQDTSHTIHISASQNAAPHQKVDDEIFYRLSGTMPAISLYSDGSNWFIY